jgi:cytochrome c oxidase assembly protein subunit 11
MIYYYFHFLIQILVIPFRKFRIIFKSETDPDMNWDFEPVTQEMVINAGETALTFYKAYNHQEKPMIGNIF